MRPGVRQFAPPLIKVGILFAIAAWAAIIASSSLISTYPYISTAVTIDLIFTLPLAYLFFIRKTTVPKMTALPVFAASVFFAALILPSGDRQVLELVVTYAIPVVELAALLYVAAIVIRSRKTYRSLADEGSDVMERLRLVLLKELPVKAAARAAAFELGVFYLAILSWKGKGKPYLFTYHKRSGAAVLLAMLLFILAAETIVVHILVAAWSAALAWIATAVSIYFAIQLFAHLKAIILRPVEILGSSLFVRCGVFGDTRISIDEIAHIDTIGPGEENAGLTLTPLGGMTPPNIRVTLKRPNIVNGIYGSQTVYSTLLLSIDEKEELVNKVRSGTTSS